SSLKGSRQRRIDGSLPSGPASRGFQDSRTVPPVTVTIPMRSGGLTGAASDTDSRNGRASIAPAPRSTSRRVNSMLILRLAVLTVPEREALHDSDHDRRIAVVAL